MCLRGVKYRNTLLFCTMAYIYIYIKHFNIYITIQHYNIKGGVGPEQKLETSGTPSTLKLANVPPPTPAVLNAAGWSKTPRPCFMPLGGAHAINASNAAEPESSSPDAFESESESSHSGGLFS